MPFKECPIARTAMRWKARPAEANREVPQPAAKIEAGIEVYSSGATRSAVKGRYDLIPAAGLAAMAEVMAKGAEVHGKDNWKKGIPVEDCINHCVKHIYQWLEGDRSERHLAHAACNLMMAIHFEKRG